MNKVDIVGVIVCLFCVRVCVIVCVCVSLCVCVCVCLRVSNLDNTFIPSEGAKTIYESLSIMATVNNMKLKRCAGDLPRTHVTQISAHVNQNVPLSSI